MDKHIGEQPVKTPSSNVDMDVIKFVSELRKTASTSSERTAMQLNQLADSLEADLASKKTRH